jgi:hypothetical protein
MERSRFLSMKPRAYGFVMADQPVRHYLWLYRLRLGMAEDATTRPSPMGLEAMKQLVAALSVMDADAPVRLESSGSSARFIDPQTGRLLAEFQLADINQR